MREDVWIENVFREVSRGKRTVPELSGVMDCVAPVSRKPPENVKLEYKALLSQAPDISLRSLMRQNSQDKGQSWSLNGGKLQQ